MAQPLGFRTDFRAQNFEGRFEWSPRASGARMGALARLTAEHVWNNAEVRSGSGRVHVLNDNNGQDFRFAPAPNWPGLFSVDVHESAAASGLQLPPTLELGSMKTVALGVAQVTDALLMAFTQVPPGMSVTADTPGRRGAWWSLGFLLRGAAARLLDVEVRELRVGLRRTVERLGTTELFFADDLENGAGYSTFLGRADVFPLVVDEAWRQLAMLGVGAHAEDCDSSCYDCLRDYSNMAHHALLDWRLARDMLSLLQDGTVPVERWAGDEERLAAVFAADFGGTSLQLEGGVWGVEVDHGRLLLIGHPLEGDPPVLSLRLADAVADAEDRGFAAGESAGWDIKTTFDLLRRPGWVHGELHRG